MNSTPLQLTMRAVRKSDYWIALPVDAPIRGGVSGDTLAELYEEVEAAKHFILDAPAEAEIVVTYLYEVDGVPPTVLETYRELRAQRDQVTTRLGESAREAVAALRAAGISVRDSAALLELSKSRVDQLSA
ncbi:hypothetical protein AB0D67_10625 [Streptosporangium sp. NPDC048047]|uniref:hypothetical protein n=1 Tax=Streptosporangium sp. NPDC048047 TaxID=3155748 RepID=UPI00341F5338